MSDKKKYALCVILAVGTRGPVFNKFSKDEYGEVVKLIKEASTDKNILNEMLIDVETNEVEVTKGNDESPFKEFLDEHYNGWRLAKIIK